MYINAKAARVKGLFRFVFMRWLRYTNTPVVLRMCCMPGQHTNGCYRGLFSWRGLCLARLRNDYTVQYVW